MALRISRRVCTLGRPGALGAGTKGSMWNHSASDKSVWYALLMLGTLPSHYLRTPFRTVSQMMFSETQRSDDIKKRGRVSLSVRESQKKGAPVPRQLRTHHQNNYASTFIPF